jgi:hypothetical protein
MKLIGCALLVVLFPSASAAQDSGIFIQAGPLLDVLYESSYDASPAIASLTIGLPGGGGVIDPTSVPRTHSNRDRLAPGGAFALGVFVSPSVSLRVETSFQGNHVTTEETSIASESTSSLLRYTTSTTDLTAAAGWHQGTGRTTVSYLAGIVFRRQETDTFARFTYPNVVVRTVGGRPVQVIEPVTTEENYTTTMYDTGLMAGIDVTVNVSSHLAIVPQVRLVGSSYSWSVRPGVLMRWRP